MMENSEEHEEEDGVWGGGYRGNTLKLQEVNELNKWPNESTRIHLFYIKILNGLSTNKRDVFLFQQFSRSQRSSRFILV